MKILATYNLKGGVGKTSSAVNLAYLAARDGYRTLLWDLDPQGAASFYFRVKPRIKGGVERLVRRKTLLDDAAKATDYEGLDLIPADFSFRNFDLALGDSKKPTKQLIKLMSPINREYDLLFIDSAPSISLVSENIFYAADALLIPLIPSTLSVRTYQQLLRYFKKERSHHLKLLPFFSMYNKNRRLHRETVENLPQDFREILKTSIPDSKKVELMGEMRAPVVHFSPDSKPARAYQKLWREIHTKV